MSLNKFSPGCIQIDYVYKTMSLLKITICKMLKRHYINSMVDTKFLVKITPTIYKTKHKKWN